MRLLPIDTHGEYLIRSQFNSKSLLTGLIEASEVHEYRSLVKRNHALICEGSSTDYLYYIKEGVVSIRQGAYTFGFIGAGHFIGLDTLLMHNKPRYTVRILETTEMYIFDRLEVMEYLFSLQEGWIFFYLLEKEARNRLLKYQHFMTYKGSERLEAMLLDLAGTFGSHNDELITLPKCFTKRRIADYANFSLNTITSLIKQLHHTEFLAPAKEDIYFRIQNQI
ncbi:Crp/Fnr family transcriptional regulator [Listeria booriae]|uniref:Crp/Fnr family transcriptional regulator n=1 Tax=Listeria booriae TaxID=1552123 RepID=UPI0016279E23|nr:Crp/Fnr family transcriptional regulator [Listeria booriae]MBC1983251.1 Crp/Fnr family transcriptional regulator [Listeria booriae]MBC2098638.1 Crp/Fnr family transcriptional regulator [Listeria booriae]